MEATQGGLSRIVAQTVCSAVVLSLAWRGAETAVEWLGLSLTETFAPSSAISSGLIVLLAPVPPAEWLVVAIGVRAALIFSSWIVWSFLEILSLVELAAVCLAGASILGVMAGNRKSFDRLTTEGAYALGLTSLLLGSLGPALKLVSGHVWAEFLSVAVCFSLASLMIWLAIPLAPTAGPAAATPAGESPPTAGPVTKTPSAA